MKQPAGVAPNGAPTQTGTLSIPGPRASATDGAPETYGDCEIAYDFDGTRVGNVHVRPANTGGAAALVVTESITDDPQSYAMPGSHDPLAGLKLRFEYRFESSPQPLTTDVALYGNGRRDIRYQWVQV